MKDFDEIIRESLLDSPEMNEELNRTMIREFEKRTGKKKSRRWIGALVIPAVLAMMGAGVYAASENGFFRDKTNMVGTVTGVTYENATAEIGVSAVYADDNVNVTLDFLKANVPPYTEIETIRLYGKNMTLTGASGEIDCTGFDTEPTNTTTDKATLVIPTGTLQAGTYQLTVNAFTGEKKADAPLDILGNWNVEFTVE